MTQQDHPSFPERIKLLKATAEDLHKLAQNRKVPADIVEGLSYAADIVMDEVLHMEAAQAKFAARKTSPQTQRASR
jgi:hypothetical protein